MNRLLVCFVLLKTVSSFGEGSYKQLYPVLAIGIKLKDHAHMLTYLFGWLENVDYPKDQTILRFYCGQHLDATDAKVEQWTGNIQMMYRSVKISKDIDDWEDDFLHTARVARAKYAFLMEGDHLLINPRILQSLMMTKKAVIAPLLDAPYGHNSTVFISDDYNNRKTIGIEQVLHVPEPLFLDLSHPDVSYLSFSRDNLPFYPDEASTKPHYVFEESARLMNVTFHVVNQYFYGYFISHSFHSLDYARHLIRYLIGHWIADRGLMPVTHSSYISPSYPKLSKFGCDKIYVINLQRRIQRKRKMGEMLKLMGFDYEIWEATDGKNLQTEPLYKEIEFLPGYEDPYHKRPMKNGEIGCFLSHYRIWKDVVSKKYSRVIIFEDDLRFTLNSTILLEEMIEDIDRQKLDWDLIYLGRKKLENVKEFWVEGYRHLSTVGYSYWTLGYMLSLNGAKKLLEGDPLKKLIPVDEYMPIKFDSHPNETWKNAFYERNLVAYSIYPTIVVPERYTHEQGYISDTEDSELAITLSPQFFHIKEEF